MTTVMVDAAKAPDWTKADPSGRGNPVRRILRLWRQGSRPDVLHFLSHEEDLGPHERLSVLRADQRQRWRSGDPVPAEWYFEHFHDVARDSELALDLIHGEFLLLEEAGETPLFDDFVVRFPQFAVAIQVQAAFHLALVGKIEPSELSDENFEPCDEHNRPKVPGYKILRELGKGGMGVVYLARQIGLDREVALKMALANGRDDLEHLVRFQREAEACACLHHPNIVEIYEIGEAQGHPYFSLELVEGSNLSQKINGGPLPTREAARITEDLSRAMQYAHDKGVIHRDLKPSNVLLTSEGVPKVADFGLAKLLAKDSDQTQSGTILGSPCYMSPEQASGEGRDVGPAGDIYSLGAILYELLTGTPPFRASTPLETLRKLLNEEPTRPSRLNPKVPQDLETICLKCLEKSPQKRYPSAGALADDLERFLNFESVLARPVTAPERLWRWCKRKTSLAIAVSLALIALMATIVLSVSFAVSQYRAAQKIGEALREIQSRQREVDQTAARLAYEHGQRLCKQGDVGQGMLWLVRGMKSARDARDRSLERAFRLNISAWQPRLHRIRVRWEHPGAIHAVAISPDGRVVATAGDDFAVQLCDVSNGAPVGPLLHHESRVTSLAFHPDGRTLFTGCDDKIARFWNLETFQQVGPTFQHDDTVYAVAFSPDGKTVLTGSFDKTAQVWNATSGARVGKQIRHEGQITSVAFSPDSKAVMTGSWDKTARIWDAATGEPIGSPLVHIDWVSSVAFSPDGTTVLTGCYDRTARIWDRASGRPKGAPFVHQHCVGAVVFSPDGTKILTGCQDGIARLWDVATGEPIGTNLRHQHTVSAVAFTPDGKSVITGGFDRTALIWDIAESSGFSIHHEGFIRAVIFRPDGQAILSASFDHTARLWDASTGAPIGEPMTHGDIVQAIAFSPNGKTILTGSRDHTARLWDTLTGKHLKLQHSGPVLSVAFSPDGDTVLTGSNDMTAQLWESVTGKPIGPPLKHTKEVVAVAFSPDGQFALTGSLDRTARLWDASTGQSIGQPLEHDGGVLAACFSPDGKTILTGSDDMSARLWVVADGTLRSLLKHNGPVSVAAFSPDGRSVITGAWDRVARVWQTETGLPEAPQFRHDGRLRALAISPNGKSVLTGSYDRTAQLWDKDTGMPVGPSFPHESQVWFVAFSPDGRTVLSGGQQQTAYLRKVPIFIEDPVETVERSIQIETGMELNDDGSLQILDLASWRSRFVQMIKATLELESR